MKRKIKIIGISFIITLLFCQSVFAGIIKTKPTTPTNQEVTAALKSAGYSWDGSTDGYFCYVSGTGVGTIGVYGTSWPNESALLSKLPNGYTLSSNFGYVYTSGKVTGNKKSLNYKKFAYEINPSTAADKTWYINSDGSYSMAKNKKLIKDEIVSDNTGNYGTYYYIDENGFKVKKAVGTKLTSDDGVTYEVVDTSGALVIAGSSNSVNKNTKSGWVQENGKWYAYGVDGSKFSNKWVNEKGTNAISSYNKTTYPYYVGSDGAMLANTTKVFSGQTYYFNANGKVEKIVSAGGTTVKDNSAQNSSTYNSNSTGSSYISNGSTNTDSTINAGNWVSYGDAYRFVKTDGSFLKGDWYFITTNGGYSGWENYWYYFDSNGNWQYETNGKYYGLFANKGISKTNLSNKNNWRYWNLDTNKEEKINNSSTKTNNNSASNNSTNNKVDTNKTTSTYSPITDTTTTKNINNTDAQRTGDNSLVKTAKILGSFGDFLLDADSSNNNQTKTSDNSIKTELPNTNTQQNLSDQASTVIQPTTQTNSSSGASSKKTCSDENLTDKIENNKFTGAIYKTVTSVINEDSGLLNSTDSAEDGWEGYYCNVKISTENKGTWYASLSGNWYFVTQTAEIYDSETEKKISSKYQITQTVRGETVLIQNGSDYVAYTFDEDGKCETPNGIKNDGGTTITFKSDGTVKAGFEAEIDDGSATLTIYTKGDNVEYKSSKYYTEYEYEDSNNYTKTYLVNGYFIYKNGDTYKLIRVSSTGVGSEKSTGTLATVQKYITDKKITSEATTKTEKKTNGSTTTNISTTYKVSFSSNGGSGSMTAVSIKKDEDYTIPECKYTKSGFTFNNWKGSDGDYYDPGDEITITKNLTLTAQWEKNVTALKTTSTSFDSSSSDSGYKQMYEDMKAQNEELLKRIDKMQATIDALVANSNK